MPRRPTDPNARSHSAQESILGEVFPVFLACCLSPHLRLRGSARCNASRALAQHRSCAPLTPKATGEGKPHGGAVIEVHTIALDLAQAYFEGSRRLLKVHYIRSEVVLRCRGLSSSGLRRHVGHVGRAKGARFAVQKLRRRPAVGAKFVLWMKPFAMPPPTIEHMRPA
jgi:hypothetical protein